MNPISWPVGTASSWGGGPLGEAAPSPTLLSLAATGAGQVAYAAGLSAVFKCAEIAASLYHKCTATNGFFSLDWCDAAVVETPIIQAAMSLSQPTEAVNVLYLQTDPISDDNRAFEDRACPRYFERMVSPNNYHFRLIVDPCDICENIKEFSRDRPIDELFLAAHGTPFNMTFPARVLDKTSLLDFPLDCFHGLSKAAKIFLLSCSTGAPVDLPELNLAQQLSQFAGKEVIAPFNIVQDEGCRLGWDHRVSVWMAGSDTPDRAVYLYEQSVARSFHGNESMPHAPDLWKEQFSLHPGLSIFVFEYALPGLSFWCASRLGAMALRASGSVGEGFIDRISVPMSKVCKITGLYNERVGEAIHAAVAAPFQTLRATGKAVDAIMDTSWYAACTCVVQASTQLGLQAFRLGSFMASKLFA